MLVYVYIKRWWPNNEAIIIANRRRCRCCHVRCFVCPWTMQHIPGGGQKHVPRLHQIYGAPTLATMDSCLITGIHPQPQVHNPAWLPVVLPLCVPTLINGPGNGPLAQDRLSIITLDGPAPTNPFRDDENSSLQCPSVLFMDSLGRWFCFRQKIFRKNKDFSTRGELTRRQFLSSSANHRVAPGPKTSGSLLLRIYQ